MDWSRNTTWRQGSVISLKSDLKTLFDKDFDSEKIAIVISHDCDIAQDKDKDPYVEFIFCKLIEEIDGKFEYGKNPRILNLKISYDGQTKFIEIDNTRKIQISKEIIVNYVPDQKFKIQEEEKQIFKSWLAIRYNRHSFPDSFNYRLNPILKYLEKKGKKYARGIMGFFFEIDPIDQELPNEEPYEFSLYIIYSVDDIQYENIAKKMAEDINSNFDDIIKDNGIKFGKVEKRKCEPYSEEEFTLRDLRKHVEYKLDYLSNRLSGEN